MWKWSQEMCWRRPGVFSLRSLSHIEKDSAFKGSNLLLFFFPFSYYQTKPPPKGWQHCIASLSNSHLHSVSSYLEDSQQGWKTRERDKNDRITLLMFFSAPSSNRQQWVSQAAGTPTCSQLPWQGRATHIIDSRVCEFAPTLYSRSWRWTVWDFNWI